VAARWLTDARRTKFVRTLRPLKLTVVIPTRNRPTQILRLLQSLERQTLDPKSFEVVVVDDGSTPPLAAAELSASRPYGLRLLRRDHDNSAHESRAAGAAIARGARVLFLDDDVEPEPHVLSSHATVTDGYAVGLILYPADGRETPYVRLQSRGYAAYARRVTKDGPSLPVGMLYICNASGPAHEFVRVLEATSSLYGGGPVPGDGCDEELMRAVLSKLYSGTASILREATVWHRDTKTIRQVRQERRQRGKTVCRLLMDRPELRSHFGETDIIAGRRGWYRLARARWVFETPRLARAVSNICAYLVETWPSVPARFCSPLLEIDLWEGVRSVSPSFQGLRTAILEGNE
jgi:hypothetical protein